MQNYNNSQTNCCCSCGIKKAICEIKSFSYLIDSYTVYYTCGNSNGEIKDSKYPNFILLQENISTATKNINLCADDILFIKIVPTELDYQSIINFLNNKYVSPFILDIPCNENCCCKSSVAAYLKDKYLESNPSKRLFTIQVNSQGPNNTIPNVSLVHLNHDVAWVLDYTEKTLYLVSLCSICTLID